MIEMRNGYQVKITKFCFIILNAKLFLNYICLIKKKKIVTNLLRSEKEILNDEQENIFFSIDFKLPQFLLLYLYFEVLLLCGTTHEKPG